VFVAQDTSPPSEPGPGAGLTPPPGEEAEPGPPEVGGQTVAGSAESAEDADGAMTEMQL
jgi:hypothetical protein